MKKLSTLLAAAFIPCSLPAELVINEILFDPSPDNDVNQDGIYNSGEDEFIEIVNTGALAIDLGGYQLTDAGGDAYTFPNIIIRPLEAVVLFGGGNPPSRINDAQVLLSDMTLNNDAGTITFLDGTFNVIQTVSWSANSEAENQSFNRDPDLTGDFTAFSAIADAFGTETPGLTSNGDYFDPSVPLLGITPESDTINESGAGNTITKTITLSSAPEFYPLEISLECSDTSEATVPANLLIESGLTGTFTVTAVDDTIPDGNQSVTITATSPNFRTAVASVVVADDSDARTLLTSPILITQFHEGPVHSNYIELTNVSDQAVDLSSFILTGWVTAATENFKTIGNLPIDGRALNLFGILDPGNSVVVTSSDATTPIPSAAADFISQLAFFNGDDSMVLYRNATGNPANIADAITFTNDGNEGSARGFVRLNRVAGYDIQPGTSLLNYDYVWQEVSIEDVEVATAESDLFLGTSSLGQARPSVTLAADQNAILESGPTNSAEFTLTLSEPPASYPVIITLSTNNPTALTIPSTIEITSGVESRFLVTAIDNNFPNADREIVILARPGINYIPNFAPLTIVGDDDARPDSESPLLFTQIMEGFGNSDYVEITNVSDQDVDLGEYIFTAWYDPGTLDFKDPTKQPSRQEPLSGILPAGAVLTLANEQATTPFTPDQVSRASFVARFSGNDSLVLYKGEIQPLNIVDALVATTNGGEFVGKSFIRTSVQQGFDLNSDATVLDFSRVWIEVTLSDVQNATSGLDAFLGTTSLAGSVTSESLAILNVSLDRENDRMTLIVRGLRNKTWQLESSPDLGENTPWMEVTQGYSRSENDDGSETIIFTNAFENDPTLLYRFREISPSQD